MEKDKHLVNVNGQILRKETQTVGGRAAYLNLRSPGAQEEATSAGSQGKHQTFSFPSHAPTCPLTQGWDQMHSYPKTELPVPWPFWNPLCFRGVEQILIYPLQCTIRYCSEQAGTCFQKAAGLGDHISLLDTINWVMSQSHNEDKFWCLLQLSWEMQTHRPKSHRGRERRTDLLCLSGLHGHQINGQCHGTPLWTDLQFFCCSQRHLGVSLSLRVAH